MFERFCHNVQTNIICKFCTLDQHLVKFAGQWQVCCVCGIFSCFFKKIYKIIMYNIFSGNEMKIQIGKDGTCSKTHGYCNGPLPAEFTFKYEFVFKNVE